jgi:hypothetical protein
MSLPPMVNGKFQKPQDITLQPLQLAALLVLDGCCVALQTGANQLGGFLKLEREAGILMTALKQVTTDKEKLVADWGRKVQLVDASAVQVKPL